MIKVWTWFPLEFTFSMHRNLESALEFIWDKVEDYEDEVNKKLNATNDWIESYNEKQVIPSLRKPLNKTVELTAEDIINMVTIFDTDMNTRLRKKDYALRTCNDKKDEAERRLEISAPGMATGRADGQSNGDDRLRCDTTTNKAS